MIDIKKIISLLSVLLVVCLMFAGCSSDKGANIDVSNDQIETEDAKIKEADAVKYIEQYSKEELGLEDVKEKYSLMVASNGVEYQGNKYIKVVANVITQNEDVTTEDGQQTFSMKGVGEYLISFDGEEVLKKDMKTNEYTKLESKTPDYSGKTGAVNDAAKAE